MEARGGDHRGAGGVRRGSSAEVDGAQDGDGLGVMANEEQCEDIVYDERAGDAIIDAPRLSTGDRVFADPR